MKWIVASVIILLAGILFSVATFEYSHPCIRWHNDVCYHQGGLNVALWVTTKVMVVEPSYQYPCRICDERK